MKWERIRPIIGVFLFCCLLAFATGITFLLSYPFLGLKEQYQKLIAESLPEFILGRALVVCISMIINGLILALIYAVFKLHPFKKYALILGIFILLGFLASSVDFFTSLH